MIIDITNEYFADDRNIFPNSDMVSQIHPALAHAEAQPLKCGIRFLVRN